ncbi:hypothetical protein Btru_005679 [Bulinus truncatus]|nr:hypothetical protein Btru_005679 [Bulinus truncatus]
MCALRGNLAVLGTLGNIINIYVFRKMGLKDAMTISFFILSICDLAYVLTMITMATSFLLMAIEISSNYSHFFWIEPYGVYIFTGNVSRIPYIMSNLTTAYLALARCLCVAEPLRFKTMFGYKITLFILTSLALFAVFSYVPVLVFMDMVLQFSPSINSTRFSLWISPKRQAIMDVVRVYRDGLLPFITQIIIMISVIIMVRSLDASRKFRESNSNLQSIFTETKSNHPIDNSKTSQPKSTKKIGGKDVQVLQQVILISIIYIICNTPSVINNSVAAIEPDFSIVRIYKNMFLTANDREYNLTEGFMCALRGIFALLGVLGNLVNIYTFSKMGLKDAMTISFLFLSISDLVYVLCMVTMATSFLFMMIEITSNYIFWLWIDPYGFYIFAGSVSRIPFIMSNLTTTYLGLARCLCVAEPLRFKFMFGSRLTLFLLYSFAFFSVATYAPALAYMGMVPQFSAFINATRDSLWISPKRQEIMDVVRVYRDGVLPFVTQVVIIISLIIMIRDLGAARKFRETHSSVPPVSATIGSPENRSTSTTDCWRETRQQNYKKLTEKMVRYYSR